MNHQLLYHEVLGQGRPCLMLAGFASDAISWIFQLPALTASRQVILCDNRGAGRSAVPEGPHSLQDMADDVLHLLNKLGIDRVDLVGHSMGGAIAQHFALRHPDRVNRLILACSFLKMSPRIQRVLEAWHLCLKEEVSSDLLARFVFPWLYSEEFFTRPHAFEMTQKLMREHPYPVSARGLAGQLEALLKHDTVSQMASLRCPTYIIAAEEDALVALAHSRELHQAIPGAKWLPLPGLGHSCMHENPGLFNQALLSCLSEKP